jgi:hypothetical protein
MSQSRSSRPLAPISANIVSKLSQVAIEKHTSQFVHVPQFMENRETQYGESESDSNDIHLLDTHSSDSSFEQHMLEEMRQHQEALSTGQKKRVAFSRANKPRIKRPQSPPLPTFTGPVDEVPIDVLDNISVGSASGSGSSVRSDERRPWGWRIHTTNRSWFEQAKRGQLPDMTPVVKDSDPTQPIDAFEDSPLSHKGSARGTPGTAQSQKSKPFSNPGTIDLLGDLSADSMLASTPAFPKRKFMSIKEAIEAGREAEKTSPFLPTPPPDSPKRLAKTLAKGRSVSSTTVQKPQKQSVSPKDLDPLTKAKEVLSSKPVPQAQREDTRNLLRLLSRSASNSPSPVQPEKATGRSTGTGIDSKHAKRSSEKVLTKDELSQPNSPSFKSAAQSNISSTATTPGQRSSTAKLGISDKASAATKTPKAIGAWIDTPVPQRSMSTIKSVQSESESQTSKKSRGFTSSLNTTKGKAVESSSSSRPKSALAAILGFAKGQQDSVDNDIGDATIHSLEDIVEASDDENGHERGVTAFRTSYSPPVTTEEDKKAIREILEHRIASELPFSGGLPASSEERSLIRQIVDKRISRGTTSADRPTVQGQDDPEDSVLTPRRKERLQEEMQLQRMADRVQSLSSYTASMRAGLKRLERNITSPSGCDHCDCPGNCFGTHPFSALGRSIFRTFVSNQNGKRHLTWFGILTSLLLLWVIVEASLCWAVCRPVYAHWTPYPFGPFEYPEPPYITLGFLQPMHGIFGVPLSIFSALGNWIRNFVLDLLVNDDVVSSNVRSTASRFMETITARLPEVTDWSMDADELI